MTGSCPEGFPLVNNLSRCRTKDSQQFGSDLWPFPVLRGSNSCFSKVVADVFTSWQQIPVSSRAAKPPDLYRGAHTDNQSIHLICSTWLVLNLLDRVEAGSKWLPLLWDLVLLCVVQEMLPDPVGSCRNYNMSLIHSILNRELWCSFHQMCVFVCTCNSVSVPLCVLALCAQTYVCVSAFVLVGVMLDHPPGPAQNRDADWLRLCSPHSRNGRKIAQWRKGADENSSVGNRWLTRQHWESGWHQISLLLFNSISICKPSLPLHHF